ncbi:hypothetical protein TNIN_170261 [Trichonephila inaurata madagascariensis]|uniref:Uncharacterized protein n=1 Tax=Trichonephila inaurata madagascariensis TaxID=2747483 RepID=A0A8X6WY29_9ARAC|nr:hypothetical protein TNIN_170261 [Trichonephila inaurata madagascariensis]
MPSKLLVSQYFAILHVVDLLQKIFSEPIFMLILMNFLHMFSMLSYFISFFKHQFTVVVIGEVVVVIATATLSTVVIIIFASKSPILINPSKRCFKDIKRAGFLRLIKEMGQSCSLLLKEKKCYCLRAMLCSLEKVLFCRYLEPF